MLPFDALFRFGHTLISGQFNMNDPWKDYFTGGYLLGTSINNEAIYGSNYDVSMTSIVKGMTLQAAQTFDNFITSELTSFRRAYTINLGFGSDLAAVNIQRGRDTGLSGWVFYRKACTGSAPENWSSRPKDISEIKWAKLQSLYAKVEDIDLYTGSLCEDPLPEAVLGTTSACIVAEQFQRLVSGDRYFFTHKGNKGAKFTQEQVSALRNVRMFDILCLTTYIELVQNNAFKLTSAIENPLASCKEAVGIDVALFL